MAKASRININIVKLQATKWAERGEDVKAGIEYKDVEPAAKALVLSEPIAIFHAGYGKL